MYFAVSVHAKEDTEWTGGVLYLIGTFLMLLQAYTYSMYVIIYIWG